MESGLFCPALKDGVVGIHKNTEVKRVEGIAGFVDSKH